MTAPAYVTRETAMTIGGFGSSMADKVDRAIFAQSRSIEDQLLRHFYPVTAAHTYHDPFAVSAHVADPGFWLERDLQSVSTLTVDDTAPSTYTLLPKDGPPYNRVIVDGFQGLNVVITGVWGYTNDTDSAGTLAAEIAATTTATCDVDGAGSAAIGVGDLLTIDDERLTVTDRAAIDSTANLNGALTAEANNVTVTVTDGSGFAVGEELLIDSERALITDIATNDLTVERAWRGSTLAAHNDATDVYAYRRLSIDRGATGTTAATHTSTTAIARNVPPAIIRDWCLAEVLNQLAQETAAYARVVGSGDNQREARGAGLVDIRRAGARMRRVRMRAL